MLLPDTLNLVRFFQRKAHAKFFRKISAKLRQNRQIECQALHVITQYYENKIHLIVEDHHKTVVDLQRQLRCLDKLMSCDSSQVRQQWLLLHCAAMEEAAEENYLLSPGVSCDEIRNAGTQDFLEKHAQELTPTEIALVKETMHWQEEYNHANLQ